MESQFISCEVEGDVTDTTTEKESGEEEGTTRLSSNMEKEEGSKVWKGVKRKYWSRDTYYLPIAIMQ